MAVRSILIPGGAGFVGSNLAIHLKGCFESVEITAFDNLKRRGSEQNLPRLREAGVAFVHGDIRDRDDFEGIPAFDLVIDCSAEASVQAGMDGAPDYLLQTNLVGTLNLLELARRANAAFLFLSTSRVYPIESLSNAAYEEGASRLSWRPDLDIVGLSSAGISEEFSLEGVRSLYGASKLAGELILAEYANAYGMPAMINRCGVIAGPWQMGRVDQGVVALWVARHEFQRSLRYIGYGGTGKQVRDVLHVRDLADLVVRQIEKLSSWNATAFNVGGGSDVSFSLLELTALCREATGNQIEIGKVPETSAVDIPIYITDNARVSQAFGWVPTTKVEEIVADVQGWIAQHKSVLVDLIP
jgi:CDP-paratose 2-epimerase